MNNIETLLNENIKDIALLQKNENKYILLNNNINQIEKQLEDKDKKINTIIYLLKEFNEKINILKICKENQFPKGGIILWFGYDIPSGFSLCDGKNGTPNLFDKFIIWSENYKLGSTGSNEKIKLKINQLPPHHHTFTANYIEISGKANSV